VTLTAPLTHSLERSVTIGASRENVFRYFTDSRRWALWWGAGSTIDPRPGGRIFILHPGNVEASGEVIDISPPESIVFSYGFASGKPMPPGSSRVTIRLDEEGADTRLDLKHEFPEAAARDEHVQGWRYQLALFSNVVLDELHANATQAVDAWFTAWSEPNAAQREAALERIAARHIRFRDRFSHVDGVPDLVAHLTAAQRFMPGLRLERDSDIRHCQGIVLADWVARAADGSGRARGTNVFAIGADRLIESVTGFWA